MVKQSSDLPDIGIDLSGGIKPRLTALPVHTALLDVSSQSSLQS